MFHKIYQLKTMEDDSSYEHPWSDVPERLRAVQTPLRSGL